MNFSFTGKNEFFIFIVIIAKQLFSEKCFFFSKTLEFSSLPFQFRVFDISVIFCSLFSLDLSLARKLRDIEKKRRKKLFLFHYWDETASELFITTTRYYSALHIRKMFTFFFLCCFSLCSNTQHVRDSLKFQNLSWRRHRVVVVVVRSCVKLDSTRSITGKGLFFLTCLAVVVVFVKTPPDD